MVKTLVIIDSFYEMSFIKNNTAIQSIKDRYSQQPNITLVVQGDYESRDIGTLLSRSIPQNEGFSCVFITKSRGSLELIRTANKQLSQNPNFQSASFLVVNNAVQDACHKPSDPKKLNANDLQELAESTEPYSLHKAYETHQRSSFFNPVFSGYIEYDTFLNRLDQAEHGISMARSKNCTSAKHATVNQILEWLDQAINIVSISSSTT